MQINLVKFIEPPSLAELFREFGDRQTRCLRKQTKYPELEKEIAPYYSTKGVRLDVYLKDEDKIIDIEMQTYPQDALGKRTRYYQSMIDMDSLMKGEDYPNLKESYVLFICKNDPFKNEKDNYYGLPCYTFRNFCEENNAVNLNDNSCKVIYNASAYKDEKDERIRKFLHFIYTNEPDDDDFSKRLLSLVEKIKDNEKFRRDYAAMNLHDRDIIRAATKEGIAQGAHETTIQNAKNFYANGVSAEIIAKSLNMTVEQIKEIVADVAVEA